MPMPDWLFSSILEFQFLLLGYIRVHHQQCGSEYVLISTINSVDVRVYPFPPPAGCGQGGVPFHSQQCKCKGVIPFSHQQCGSEDVQYLFPQPTVWTWECSPVYSKHCGCESVTTWWWIFVYSQQCGHEGVSLSTGSSETCWCFPFHY